MVNPSTQSRAIEIALLPDPAHWPGTLPVPSDPIALSTRSQLALPIDRPIIASGHQPIIFHPGIVAKLIALDHWSKRTGSAAVWIVPDQDVVDPTVVRMPHSSGDRLNVTDIRLSDQQIPVSPSAMLAPITVRDDLPDQLRTIGDWITGYEHETTLARQCASATIGLLCEQLGLDEPILIYASDLIATDAGGAMVDAMLEDPRAAVGAYNDAIERFPDAGVRPLLVSEARIELPLWKIEGGRRVPLTIDPGASETSDPSTLMPRGLLMTAIMRSAICELFIHGTGGYHYDQITQHWMQRWRGLPLAPLIGASATMTLDLPIQVSDPDRAVWKAHHARHDPSMLNDPARADRKSRLIDQIRASKEEGEHDRSSAFFAELQEMLSKMRSEHATEIAELDDAASRAQSMRDQHAISTDRTWGFPLYPLDQLQSLRDQIVRTLDR